MTPRLARLLRIALFALVLGLLGLFVRRIQWDKLGAALGHAIVWPLVASTLLYFANLYGKALTWRILLAPEHEIRTNRLFRYTITAFAASALAPARAGELLRVWALKRCDGVPAHDTTAVALAEKLLDAVSLLIVVAPVPWLLPSLPRWVGDAMLTCGAIAAGVALVVYIAVRHVEARAPASWFGRFIAGLHAFRDPHRITLALATLILVWLADLSAVMLVLYAVGVSVPVAGGLFILFTFNLAIAIPSTPAQVGAMQLGALAATRLLKIPDEPALAFALLYQAMQVVPLLVVGLATARGVRRPAVSAVV